MEISLQQQVEYQARKVASKDEYCRYVNNSDKKENERLANEQAILASLRRLDAIENAGMPEEPDVVDELRSGATMHYNPNFSNDDGDVVIGHIDALRLYAERMVASNIDCTKAHYNMCREAERAETKAERQALLLDEARALLVIGMYDSEKTRKRMHNTVHAIDELKAGKP